MSYQTNETFVSIQGEGFWAGVPATFIRLQGCSVGCDFCLAEGTPILMADWTSKPIQDVLPGEQVMALTEVVGRRSRAAVPTTVVQTHANGVHDTLVINEQLVCTPHHRVLIDNGYISRWGVASHLVPEKHSLYTFRPKGYGLKTLTREPVVSARPGTSTQVYDLTTEAGSYIANGYVVHNCDTKYTWAKGGKRMQADEIAGHILTRHVVITGGEPTAYNLDALLIAIRKSSRPRYIQLETSGQFPLKGKEPLDWITWSPKERLGWGAASNILTLANEVKWVVDEALTWETVTNRYALMMEGSPPVFTLMPEGSPPRPEMITRAIQWCLRDPYLFVFRYSDRLHTRAGVK